MVLTPHNHWSSPRALGAVGRSLPDVPTVSLLQPAPGSPPSSAQSSCPVTLGNLVPHSIGLRCNVAFGGLFFLN